MRRLWTEEEVTETPRTRGWTGSPGVDNAGVPGDPADAGMDLHIFLDDFRRWWRPRGRGDGPLNPTNLLRRALETPQTRGWTHRGDYARQGKSGNPAEAGVSKERIFESTLVILTPKRPKSNKKSASASQKVKKPKPRVEPTPAEVEAREQNRREYEQRPERKEQKRRYTAARRQAAKSLGLCVDCGTPPHTGQDQMRNLR